jgi:hypothetical protein
MPIFFHDICLFGDEAGFAVYRQEHAYEHVQFVQIGQKSGPPPKLIADYDLSSWDNTKEFARNWLTTHENVHDTLRQITGVSGINLADVDLSKPDEWYEWLDAHRSEHAALRQAFGITN